MMKHKIWSRALSLAVSVIMLVSLLCVPAFAEENGSGASAEDPLEVSGDALVYNEKNGIVGVSQKWYDSLNLNGATLYVSLTIPAEMNGTPVTKIAYQALQYKNNGFRSESDVLTDGLKNIKIVSVDFSQAANLETIGDFAFDQRPELGGVIDLSNTKVTEIGAGAFRGTGITGVILPDTLQALGNTYTGAGSFAMCKKLQYVRAASSKDSEKAVVLPERLTTIGEQCFRYSFAQAVHMEIPASVATVGAEAFNSDNILQLNVLHSGDFTGYDKYAFQRKAGELNIFLNAQDYSAAYRQAYSTAQKCMTYELSVNFKVKDALLETQTKLYNQYFLYEKDENGIWTQNEEYRLPSGDMAAGYEYDWKYANNSERVTADSKVNDGSVTPQSIDVVTSGSKLTAPTISIEMPNGSYVHEDSSITLKGVIGNKVDGLHYDMVWAVYNQMTDEWDELPGETGDTLTVTGGAKYYLFACEAYDDKGVRSEQEGDYVYISAAPHQWSYAASGNTVTASCTQTRGVCPYTKYDLTLSAPDAIANGRSYDKAATASTIPGAISAGAIQIVYQGVDGTDYESSATAPTAAGRYEASVTIGGATATRRFRIYGASEAFTVDFETNGGTAVAQLVKEKDAKLAEGDAVTTREGYTFAGWYKDPGFANAWDHAVDTVTGNITLYAKWKPDGSQISGGRTGSGKAARSGGDAAWALAYRDCPRDETCPIWPFTDAETTQWYHDGVHFCLENGLMVGYGDQIFRPDASTTRAMIAAMLWRLSGSPVVNDPLRFDDVDAGAWYAEAIRWAVSEGIAFGYGGGKFGPDDIVTREQMVTILYRYAQHTGCDVSIGENTNILSYDDAFDVAPYAVPAMQWACGSGTVTGTARNGGVILSPRSATTRAQMATMMMRFCAEIKK